MPPTTHRFFAPVTLARLLLVVLPCVPGLIFLAVGLLRDPRSLSPDQSPSMQAERTRAVSQAHGLYLAGAVTLLGGTLGMAVVIWKIARTKPEELDSSSEKDPPDKITMGN